MQALITLLDIIGYLLNLYGWVITIQIVLSLLIAFNVVNTYNDFVASLWKGLTAVTEPAYRPIRRLLPATGAIDFAPFLVLVAITVITRFVIPGIEASLLTSPPM